MKKVLRETQTLSAGCSEAQPKFFAPPQTPFPEAWDGQNLISWRWSLPLPTDPVWWGSMHAISSYRGNRPTQTWAARPLQTRPQTGPITVHYAAKHVQCYKPLIVRLIDWSMDGWTDGAGRWAVFVAGYVQWRAQVLQCSNCRGVHVFNVSHVDDDKLSAFAGE